MQVGLRLKAVLAAAAALLCCCAPGARAGAGPDAAAQAATAKWLAAQAGPGAGFALDLGCGDAGLAIQVAKASRLMVQCVDADEKVVEKARAAIDAAGVYGTGACADRGDLARLPYPDGCARLVFCGDELVAGLPPRNLKEIVRVLHPFGVALIGQSPAAARAGPALSRAQLEGWLKEAGVTTYKIVEENGLWARLTKPRPESWDEWPARNHDAGNSCSSSETLPGMDYHMQWVNHPEPVLASAGLCVAGGRQYVLGYYYKGQEHATPSIYAYDACTGIKLWSLVGKKDIPFDRTLGLYAPEKSCSDFVAAEDQLYVLGGNTCYAFDGATGEIKGRFPVPGGAGVFNYLGCVGETLVCAAGGAMNLKPGNYSMYSRGMSSTVFALDRRTGAPKWSYRGGVLTNSLCAGEGKVFFLTADRKLHGLELASGRELWAAGPVKFKNAAGGGSVVLGCYYRGKLWMLYNQTGNWLDGGRQSAVFSAADGKLLHEPTFTGVVHMLAFAGDYAVASPQHSGNPSTFIKVDTGETAWTKGLPLGGCTPVFGAKNMLLARLGGGPGLIELNEKLPSRAFGGIRSTCFLPPIPAYGMLFVPAPGCHCNQPFRANMAMVPGKAPPIGKDNPLVKGPAFGSAADEKITNGWRTWRNDPARSGASAAKASGALAQLWTAKLGGTAAPLCVAGGTVFVGATDRKFCALDAATGKPRWQYIAGGGLATAPCLWNGRAYFGDEDGWVHCLRADNGQLVWSFRAALAEDRIFGLGRPMSRWPVGCGVLVFDGTALFTAGFYTEDQNAAYALDAATGQLKWRSVGRAAAGGALASDGKRLIVPSRWSAANQIALEGAAHGFGGAGGARGSTAMLVDGNHLIYAPDLEYTHHVDGYHRFPATLPIVTSDTVYLRDGYNLTAEKREAFQFKDGKLEPTGAAPKPGTTPAALKWQAWKGESMTAIIKVGSVLFSGGDGKVFATGEDGRQIGSLPVPGKILDLAFDDGRLVVLCEPAAVVCFKAGP